MEIAGKRYRIKSSFRFTIFVVIAILLTVMALNALLGTAEVRGATVQETYMELQIQAGDTLWDIASSYMPDTDTRKAVYILGQINDISAGGLQAGMTIQVPVDSI